MEKPRQKSRRAANACIRCRYRKAKCSGTQPCESCNRRNVDCIFEDDRKILVSKDAFLGMKRRLAELEESLRASSTEQACTQNLGAGNPEQPSEPSDDAVSSPVPILETARSDEPSQPPKEGFQSNPLVVPLRFLRDDENVARRRRPWLLLGPTSTWAFSRRVLNTLGERFVPEDNKAVPLAVDGEAYQFQYHRSTFEDSPDLTGLPSHDYAIYMLNTVQFHLGQLFRLFDEEEFLHNLHEFYADAATKVQESPLWYVQFLLVLAFGEAFLTPIRNTHIAPGWGKYFTRAMSLMPDISALWPEPILAIEVLTMIALYLHSVDLRDTAYCYIGNAMRMALVEGYHGDLPLDQLGEKRVERCRSLWWTVYILDCKFSTLIGAPNSMRDEDITTSLWDPTVCSQRNAVLGMHARISQTMSRVQSTVYGVDKKLGDVLLPQRVGSVLHQVAGLTQDLERLVATRIHSSTNSLSGVVARLTLFCHLCIIVTARPLVFALLRSHLSFLDDGKAPRALSSTVQALVQTCVDSASKTLKILASLRSQNLLHDFLPFDLDNVFSAAFILSLISGILPGIIINTQYRQMSNEILDTMIVRGNRVAEFRKRDLDRLDELIQPLLDLSQQRRQTCGLDEGAGENPQDSPTDISMINEPDVNFALLGGGLAVSVETEDELGFNLSECGLSFQQMVSAANQLDANEVLGAPVPEAVLAEDWLWGSL